jgi:hypothetical protein
VVSRAPAATMRLWAAFGSGLVGLCVLLMFAFGRRHHSPQRPSQPPERRDAREEACGAFDVDAVDCAVITELVQLGAPRLLVFGPYRRTAPYCEAVSAAACTYIVAREDVDAMAPAPNNAAVVVVEKSRAGLEPRWVYVMLSWHRQYTELFLHDLPSSLVGEPWDVVVIEDAPARSRAIFTAGCLQRAARGRPFTLFLHNRTTSPDDAAYADAFLADWDASLYGGALVRYGLYTS